MKLTANYLLGVLKILLLAVLFIGGIEYIDHITKGKPFEYTLLIPLILLPVAICLMFGPKYIVADENGFGIKFILRKSRYILFKDVRAYGRGRAVFQIQPNTGSTLQIYSGIFPRKGWRTFVELLETKCPGKKASTWIGPWAVDS